jgi:hypothetical protein
VLTIPKDGKSFAVVSKECSGKIDGLTRRSLLKNAAGVILAAASGGLTGVTRLCAQVEGSMPGGGTLPFRLPMGAMDHLDRKQYIHNMEIHSHLPNAGSITVGGGEPLTTMWARGAQRLIPASGGFIDISDGRNPVVLNKGLCQGFVSNVAYNTKLKKWILINSAGMPITDPNPQYPHGQYDKEYRDKVIAFKGHKGIWNYDITDPTNPILLEKYSTGEAGQGTHMNFYDGGQYAYLDCGWDDQLRMESSERPFSQALMIVDVSDPAHTKEVSRWWVPGQRFGEEEEYKKYPFAGDHAAWTSNHGGAIAPKRVEDGGTIAYTGFGHFGMFVLDLSDIRHPKPIGRVTHPLEGMGGIPYHTIYPVIANSRRPQLQDLVIAVFESLEADCREPFHTSYVINVKDPRNPKIIGLFPRPVPPPDAPYTDFCFARGRFSSHDIQSWLAPGLMRPEFVALTYFNAGIRIYDISHPNEPNEVAWFVPARDGNMPPNGTVRDFNSWHRGTTENVFVEWDRNLIWVTTHEGLYCMSTPFLGKPILEPRKVEKWSVAHCNIGWDDQTRKSVYFGRPLTAMG